MFSTTCRCRLSDLSTIFSYASAIGQTHVPEQRLMFSSGRFFGGVLTCSDIFYFAFIGIGINLMC